ncbi:MAG: VWA domain-containing protein [Bacteroidetes Order II. Incertae sedis bacterium]|nr:VWA domain-containing protein [Bacteroidetes Order II. bacterium]
MKNSFLNLFILCAIAFPMGTRAQIAIENNDAPMSRAAMVKPDAAWRPYEVKSIVVNTQFRDQVAETQVSQTIHNPSHRVMEVELLFPLPDGGSVQSFTLMVNGKEMPGRLLPKEEARGIYEEIVRRKKDPALMEYAGYGLFKTSIFPIPPGEDRTITLKYTQLCTKEKGVVSFSYPFGTQKFSGGRIGKVVFKGRIVSTEPLKTLYSPTDQLQIDRPSNREAIVSFEETNVRRERDFKLSFTAEAGEVGATVLSFRPDDQQDGYFMLLATPDVKTARSRKILPKTVLFVLDRSGSMEGKKLVQAKEALKFVLNNLREGDYFNIVDYDDSIRAWKPALQPYNADNRREALRYTEAIESGGGTNIHSALEKAMQQIQDEKRPNYVLFLTDGLPTAGNTNEMQIAENTRRRNRHQARVFAFGVGEDVNARLLDRLVNGNGGRSEYVSLEDNLEAKIAAFYSGITAPLLTNIRIEMSHTDLNRSYPSVLPDLFEGGQIVWVGRYNKSGKTKVSISGKVGDELKTFRFDADLAQASDGTAHSYVEKLWATRRIGTIIDQIDLNGRNEELVNELVSLSKKHGILTPYTSFLADEDVDLRATSANMQRAYSATEDLNETSGAYANAQRSAKQDMMNQAVVVTNKPMAKRNPVMPSARNRGGVASEPPKVEEEKETLQQVGTKTFYLRNNNWIEGEITAEEEKTAKVIKLMTEEYFAFTRSQTPEVNQYLNLDRTTIVRIGNQVYKFER